MYFLNKFEKWFSRKSSISFKRSLVSCPPPPAVGPKSWGGGGGYAYWQTGVSIGRFRYPGVS